MTCRAVEASGSADYVDAVEVIPQGPVWIGCRKLRHKGILKEDRITRVGYLMMPHVEDITVDREHLNPNRASKIACRNAVGAKAYR